MLKKIKNKLIAAISVLALAIPVAVPSIAHADVTGQVTGGVCTGADKLSISDTSQSSSSTCDVGDQTTSFNTILTRIINILSVIVGVIAVIMIVIGGFRYITSGGQAEKVTGAKNTILYALIGLIIVALAQVIVRFVLNKTTSGI